MSETPVDIAQGRQSKEYKRWDDKMIPPVVKVTEAFSVVAAKMAPSLWTVRHEGLDNPGVAIPQGMASVSELAGIYMMMSGNPEAGGVTYALAKALNLAAEGYARVKRSEKSGKPERPGLENQRLVTQFFGRLGGAAAEVMMPTVVSGRRLEGGWGGVQVVTSGAEIVAGMHALNGSWEGAVGYAAAKGLSLLTIVAEAAYDRHKQKKSLSVNQNPLGSTDSKTDRMPGSNRRKPADQKGKTSSSDDIHNRPTDRFSVDGGFASTDQTTDRYGPSDAEKTKRDEKAGSQDRRKPDHLGRIDGLTQEEHAQMAIQRDRFKLAKEENERRRQAGRTDLLDTNPDGLSAEDIAMLEREAMGRVDPAKLDFIDRVTASGLRPQESSEGVVTDNLETPLNESQELPSSSGIKYEDPFSKGVQNNLSAVGEIVNKIKLPSDMRVWTRSEIENSSRFKPMFDAYLSANPSLASENISVAWNKFLDARELGNKKPGLVDKLKTWWANRNKSVSTQDSADVTVPVEQDIISSQKVNDVSKDDGISASELNTRFNSKPDANAYLTTGLTETALDRSRRLVEVYNKFLESNGGKELEGDKLKKLMNLVEEKGALLSPSELEVFLSEKTKNEDIVNVNFDNHVAAPLKAQEETEDDIPFEQEKLMPDYPKIVRMINRAYTTGQISEEDIAIAYQYLEQRRYPKLSRMVRFIKELNKGGV